MSATTHEMCDHQGAERVTRVAHGYLGDAPAGTIETLCADCGAVLTSERRGYGGNNA